MKNVSKRAESRRTILIVGLGTFPAVLTETVRALVKQTHELMSQSNETAKFEVRFQSAMV